MANRFELRSRYPTAARRRLGASLALLGTAAMVVCHAGGLCSRAEEMKPRGTLKGHRFPVTCLAFSPDGKTLASGSGASYGVVLGGPGELKVWDVATGKELHHGPRPFRAVTCVAFTPDGRTLASGTADGQVLLWTVPVTRNKP
jgi:hypothetical protein